MMRNLFVLLGGILFGAGLVISGMTDPSRVIGFLDLFGDWQPALAFVMGGALVTFGIGLLLLKRSGKGFFGCSLPDTSADPVQPRRILGAALFGIGWGLAGFCPGPAIANIANLRMETLWFVPAMLAGMVIVQQVFRIDRPE